MRAFLDHLPLIDHHCHGVVDGDLDRPRFEALFSEGHRPVAGCSQFDKPLGLVIRRHCAPLLDLPAFAAPEAYIGRRAELGAAEVNRRLIVATGVCDLLVDTGHRSDAILDPAALTALTGISAREVVRIEAVMEAAARASGSGAELRRRFDALLTERAAGAIGLKSIVAYRCTFDIDQSDPAPSLVESAGDAWLAALAAGTARRLEDPVLIRYALWRAGELCRQHRYPLQLHVGFGDQDILMPKCDPTWFTPFIQAMEAWDVPLTLLHCWPFIREAAFLAEVFSNVYFDVGVILNYTGPSAIGIMAEAMELAPFYKQLYSSDAFGLAELHYIGARIFRDTLGDLLSRWIADGHVTVADAERYARMIASENARRIYPLA